jgi:hypothetical protein
LGEHTAGVLAEFGFSAAEIAELRTSGAIGSANDEDDSSIGVRPEGTGSTESN